MPFIVESIESDPFPKTIHEAWRGLLFLNELNDTRQWIFSRMPKIELNSNVIHVLSSRSLVLRLVLTAGN
jgi:hypothetical protein